MLNLNKRFQKNKEGLIKCTVRTTQFKDGAIHEWKVQDGYLDLVTLLFTSNDKTGGHNVQFHSLEDFKKFKV